MALSNVFKTATASHAVMDGSQGDTSKPGVSNFITVQSFTNFAAVSGGITAAWHALPTSWSLVLGLWFPYSCAFLWAIISYQISKDGLGAADANGNKTVDWGTALQAVFIAFINALVLAGSVVGTNAAVKAATAT